MIIEHDPKELLSILFYLVGTYGTQVIKWAPRPKAIEISVDTKQLENDPILPGTSAYSYISFAHNVTGTPGIIMHLSNVTYYKRLIHHIDNSEWKNIKNWITDKENLELLSYLVPDGFHLAPNYFIKAVEKAQKMHNITYYNLADIYLSFPDLFVNNNEVKNTSLRNVNKFQSIPRIVLHHLIKGAIEKENNDLIERYIRKYLSTHSMNNTELTTVIPEELISYLSDANNIQLLEYLILDYDYDNPPPYLANLLPRIDINTFYTLFSSALRNNKRKLMSIVSKLWHLSERYFKGHNFPAWDSFTAAYVKTLIRFLLESFISGSLSKKEINEILQKIRMDKAYLNLLISVAVEKHIKNLLSSDTDINLLAEHMYQVFRFFHALQGVGVRTALLRTQFSLECVDRQTLNNTSMNITINSKSPRKAFFEWWERNINKKYLLEKLVTSHEDEETITL